MDAQALAELGRDLFAAVHTPPARPESSVTITEPGLYQISAADYHADPVPGGSLSSSGARLLEQTCPAIFRYRQTQPEQHKDVFDFGKAAHAVVLGDGPELVEVKADSWRTSAAQKAKAEAHEAGKTPLLSKDLATVSAMAVALAEHPIAGSLFDSSRGRPEMGLFWTELAEGGNEVWCRALLDWLPDSTGGRLVIPDYKTAPDASPEAFAKAVTNYGYHQQADWYLTGVRALDLDPDPAFVFIVQEKTPPYLVEVWELPADAYRIADQLNTSAINTYANCQAENRWPSYTDGVGRLSLPGWYLNRFEIE